MELTWWPAAIIGCVALAGCVVAALLWPTGAERRKLRPLANVGRLTRLPEYVRAARLRALSTAVTIGLLLIIFVGTVVAAARPAGLPSSATTSDAGQPEDIMICIGGPVTDRAAGAVLQYFADRVTRFSTERIGLSSSNRRVVPLTRDYQYAAARFADFAAQAGQQGDVASFTAPVTYADYAESVEDVLAMCLTGFPSFEEKTAQRRSLIYVGPEQLRAPGDPRLALFTSNRIRELASAGAVQVNVAVTGTVGDTLPALARDTGGRSYSADSDMAAKIADIRNHPPPPTASDDRTVTKAAETPDIPIVIAVLAALALVLWPVVVRR